MLADRDYMHNDGRFTRAGTVSYVKPLLIANVAVFILQKLSGDGLTFLLCLSGPTLRQLQVWRLVTYMFVHGGLMHIFFNMWALHLFGRPVEQALGPGRFLRLYFVSGILGALLWLLFNWRSPTPVIGASGAVFGVMGAAAMLFPSMRIMLLLPPMPMKLRTFVICYAILEAILEVRRGASSIAHLAHLGGLAGGLLFVRHQLKSRGRRRSVGGGVRRLLTRWLHTDRRVPRHRPELRRVPPPDTADVLSSEVDPILDKIGRSGIGSLTPGERGVLEQARRKLRD